MGTALLVIGLMVVCGAIAYTGDLLGRRLGKRRLSIFGLRPKHTAIVLTIITGVVIAGVTFGAAMAAVPWFRRAVTEGEELANENRHLSEDNRLLANENRNRVVQSRELEAEIKQLGAENADLAAQGRKLAAVNGRLVEEQDDLQRRTSELRRQNDQLRLAGRKLGLENSSLKRRGLKLAAEYTELANKYGVLRQDLARVEAMVRDQAGYVERVNRGPYAFLRGERIWLQVIPENPPTGVVRSTVENVRWNVEQMARDRGARPKGGKSVIYQVPPPGYPAQLSLNPTSISEWLALQARKSSRTQLLLEAVVEDNIRPGYPVPIYINCQENELVFRQGEVVALSIVNPRDERGRVRSVEQLHREIRFFLQSRVGPAAAQRGMMRSENYLGELSPERALRICGEIQTSTQPVIVLARARQEIRRAGPLHLDLEAKPVEGL